MTTNNAHYRCVWSQGNPLLASYHDSEWGVPVHNDFVHFEFLILEGAQAGLNWLTILNKREGYRKAFSNFNAKKVAMYSKKDNALLLANSGIIRNRLKIASAIGNANAFLQVQKEFGSFDEYVWQFVQNKTINHHIKVAEKIPATARESEAMSKDLRERNFKFVGPTICYAYMQAVGMINDHETKCFRFKELS